MEKERDVIIACDFGSGKQALEFLDKFAGEDRKPFVKIGMELYYAAGNEIVRELKRRGHSSRTTALCSGRSKKQHRTTAYYRYRRQQGG